MRRVIAIGLWVLASGCPEPSDPPPQTGSTSSDEVDTTAAASSTGVGEQSTGEPWPGPTDDELLTCVRSCEGPWDCCPPGTVGSCPGPGYPYNYMCIEGLCVHPPCFADDECPGEGERCLEIRGAPRCVLPCTDDAPCEPLGADFTCSGQADDATAYCFEHCTHPNIFCGNTTCDELTGECLCADAGQCQTDWECV